MTALVFLACCIAATQIHKFVTRPIARIVGLVN